MTRGLMGRLARGAAAAILAGGLTLQPVRAETLTDALISAYETSGLLEQNRALLRAADEDVAQAVAAMRPVLNYLASVDWADPVVPGADNVSGSLALSLDWLLFDFGRSQLAVEAAKESVLALRAALVGVEQQVLLRAVAAYMNVRRAIAFVELNQNNIRVITQQLRAAEDRFEVGEVTRTDVSVVEARLAAARSQLAAARGQLETARQEYLAVVGRLPTNLRPPPPTPATAGSLDAATAIALDRHPALLEAQRQVRVADLGVARAQAALRPSLNAGARLSVDDDGDDRQSVGLSLSGPIYRGGGISAQIRSAQARRDAARAGLLLSTQQVVQNVANAWSNVQVATAVIAASDEQVRAAQLALEGAREEFQVGESTTIDVLDREQELLNAQTDRIEFQVDRYIAVFELLSRMGLLTVDHLELGIPTYDPAAYYEAVRNAPLGNVSPQGDRLDRMLRAIGRE